MARGLKLVGLTGGIGSGKSTVARLVAERGVPVLDADELAREVVAPGQPAAAEIAATWPEVARPGGAGIDRKRLAAIVFADPAQRLRLEAITHPRIQALGEARARYLAAQGHRLAFYEASLLVETGRHRDYDGLVVVTATPETQLARAVARGLTPDEARARIAAQLPLADKVRAATHVIHNDADLEATRAQVEALLAQLR